MRIESNTGTSPARRVVRWVGLLSIAYGSTVLLATSLAFGSYLFLEVVVGAGSFTPKGFYDHAVLNALRPNMGVLAAMALSLLLLGVGQLKDKRWAWLMTPLWAGVAVALLGWLTWGTAFQHDATVADARLDMVKMTGRQPSRQFLHVMLLFGEDRLAIAAAYAVYPLLVALAAACRIRRGRGGG